METDCSHNKTIWIFLPGSPLKIYVLEGTKSVSNEGMDDSSKCAMVCNEFNTWQIMQMALKMSSLLASLCPIQLNKTCIKNKSIFFVLHAHVFWIWAMAQSVHLERVISFACFSLFALPKDEFYGFQGRFYFQPHLLYMGSFTFCLLICNVVISSKHKFLFSLALFHLLKNGNDPYD